MTFRNLHAQDTPLIIGNVWDVPSTKIAERSQFQAIGTSSSAIASLLGYEDGEEMRFSELEYMTKRIALHAKTPLSVDLESGYSRNPVEIAHHIARLTEVGVVGVNLEDSVVEEERKLLDADEFANTIREVRDILRKQEVEVFLNIRTDSFLLGHDHKIEESKRRIQLYEAAGADGIFTPCIENVSDIKEMVASTHLPINVMCMPKLPDFSTLAQLGVKRISIGNFLFDKMYQQFEATSKLVLDKQSFKSIF